MDKDLFNNTKLAAYFLWEATGYENALGLWFCAEDIGSFLERFHIETASAIEDILKRGKTDLGYIHFVRHIAFRIFIYTNCEDSERNWYDAEALVRNSEWQQAITTLARIYRDSKHDASVLSGVKSEAVREYYQ